VYLTTFTSLHALFERLPTDLDLSDGAKDALQKLLFEPTYEGLPETMRLRRAEALVVVAKVRSCRWVGEMVREEIVGEGVERSAVVRGVLGSVERE
jgi:proteasome component ECM29